MSKWDLSIAFAPTEVVERRQTCTTYESAMSYVRDRVKEQKKAYTAASTTAEKENAVTWVQKNKHGEGYYVSVNLKTMPVFWQATFNDAKKITIYNPDGSVREERPEIQGMSRLPVSSIEQGLEFLDDLASGEHENLNERIRIASAAYADVVEVELPAINEKAEMLYNDSEWLAEFGAWGEPNEQSPNSNRMVISKKKTNKMNQFKQLARRQLGYKRWTDTLERHKA
jgi:hypothetical protein